MNAATGSVGLDACGIQLVPGAAFGVVSSAAAVADGELIAWVWREELGDVAEALGERLRGDEGVLALAELRVVEVAGEGEEVDGDGVGEGGLDEVGLGFLVDVLLAVDLSCSEGEVAALPGVLAGFAADVGEGLVPDELGEGLWDADGVDEGVADVDEELECEGEAVAEEAGGDEDAVGAAEGSVEGDVAVADGLVGEIGCADGGDHSGVGGCAVAVGAGDVEDGVGAGLAHGEGDEEVGLAAEGAGDGDGNSLDHALELEVGEAGFAVGRVGDAVGGLSYDCIASYLARLYESALNTICHKEVF